MTTPVYAKDVPVKVRPVEIKVIQVGPKQMSLALFKQIPEKSIIDTKTGELMGLEWGRVCGTWSWCCEAAAAHHRSFPRHSLPPHSHVIWEQNGILYKCSLLWLPTPSKKASEQAEYLGGIDQLFIGA